MSAAQWDLFVRHSGTSRAAAESIRPDAATLRAKVLRLLEGAPAGLTDEQIQDALGMPANTERPRRVELQRGGFVRDSLTTRATKSGRSAVVWVAEKAR